MDANFRSLGAFIISDLIQIWYITAFDLTNMSEWQIREGSIKWIKIVIITENGYFQDLFRIITSKDDLLTFLSISNNLSFHRKSAKASSWKTTKRKKGIIPISKMKRPPMKMRKRMATTQTFVFESRLDSAPKARKYTNSKNMPRIFYLFKSSNFLFIISYKGKD